MSSETADIARMRPASARRPRLRARPLCALALLLAACAGPSHEPEVAEARQMLVGLPVEALLACAGTPDRAVQVQGAEHLVYVAREAERDYGPTGGVSVGAGSSGVGLGVGLGVPLLRSRAEPAACEATFVARDGVVEALTYGPGAEPRQCYRIVRNCLGAGPA